MTEQASDGSPPRTDPGILEHYSTGSELTRLDRHPFEFERHKQILAEWLPSRGRILDVGGGAGPYSSLLAEQGYEVDLIDPVPLHIEEAQELARTGTHFSAHLGDARSLDFPDAIADAVLLMGPLYSLPDAAERRVCLLEAFRVLRPGGVLFAAALGRYARFIPSVRYNAIRDRVGIDRIVTTIQTGVMLGAGGKLYMHRPEELHDEITETAFRDVKVLAVGLGFLGLTDIRERMADRQSLQGLLDLLHRVGRDPGILGITGKLMAVGHHPGQG